ncbi:MAG: hypothetical protein WAW75_10130 [Gallionella sp.]
MTKPHPLEYHDSMTAVAIQYRDQIIAGVSQGNRLTDVIRELGLAVTPQALSKVLTSDPDYAAAVHIGTIARLDKAEDELHEASEQVDVSRASAYHRAISWRAEREVPDRYGIKQAQITINNNVLSISDSLVGQAGELLSQLRVCNTVQPVASQQLPSNDPE